MDEKHACGRASKPNQLITGPSTRRDEDGGKIKAENILEHKEGKHVKKTRRQYFGIWHVYMAIVKAISSP